jgi:sortase A
VTVLVRPRGSRVRSRIGLVLIAVGVLAVAWTAVTYFRGDPITAVYTWYEQRGLARQVDRLETRWAGAVVPAAPSGGDPLVAYAGVARAFARSIADGDAIGRIAIPRIGLRIVVVQGTSTGDLARGPGHYDAQSGHATAFPGEGGVVAIAGHRTTFLAPFRHLDELQRGDRIELRMPYGSFVYRVIGHRTVLPTDWSILRPRGFEELVLSACTPVYSASHRLVVFARLVGVGPTTRSA